MPPVRFSSARMMASRAVRNEGRHCVESGEISQERERESDSGKATHRLQLHCVDDELERERVTVTRNLALAGTLAVGLGGERSSNLVLRQVELVNVSLRSAASRREETVVPAVKCAKA